MCECGCVYLCLCVCIHIDCLCVGKCVYLLIRCLFNMKILFLKGTSNSSSNSNSGSESNDEDLYYNEIIYNNENNFHPLRKKLFEMLQNEEANESISANIVVNKIEILLAILKISTVYSFPNSAVADLCKMFNTFFDIPILPDSRYLIDQLFFPGENIEYHALCPECKNYVKKFDKHKRHIICKMCDKGIDLKDPLYHDFFVILDISNELKHILETNQNYYTDIMNRNYEDQTISDIYDGQQYKDFIKSLPEEHKKSYASFIFNSDGSPVFKSSKFSIWPIQVNLNEVPPSVRSKKPLTFGLWFGHDKPNMNIFLKPFIQNINKLSNVGVRCKINNEEKNIHIYAICCCVDTIARAPMQGLMQFNGYFGCNWCLHPGKLVGHGRKIAVKYPLLYELPPRRSEEMSLFHIREALDSNTVVNGFKKATPLLNLKCFNIIDGFVPDAMHCIALGVVKQFLNLWFSSSNEPYSISNANATQIDKYLTSLKAPTQIARLSRPLKDRKYWKSIELENWLLYYSLPALEQIDNFKRYCKHWALLVNAFHILMQSSITIDELVRADVLLKQFVAETQLLYSKKAMTFNVHQLIHISQSVADWGPLWAHSGYPFESGNGQIVRNVHAAKGVVNQVCRNLSVTESLIILEKHIASTKDDSPVTEYCHYLQNRCTKETLKIGNNRYFVKCSKPQFRCIQDLNLPENNMQTFKKLVRNESAFKSCHKSLKRSDNSFAQIDNGQYIQIQDFIVGTENNIEYTLYKRVQVENTLDINTYVKRVLSIDNEINFIETNQLKKLCIYMKINKKHYISAMPHMYRYS